MLRKHPPRRRWGRWSWAPKEGRAALSVGVGLGVLGDLPRTRRSRRSSAYAESAGQNWDRSDGLPLGSSEGSGPGRLPPRTRDRFSVRYVARFVGRAVTWLRAKTPATPPRAANVCGASSRLPRRLAGGEVLDLVRRPRTCSKAEGARVRRGAG